MESFRADKVIRKYEPPDEGESQLVNIHRNLQQITVQSTIQILDACIARQSHLRNNGLHLHSGVLNWAQEYCTIRIDNGRQSGHSHLAAVVASLKGSQSLVLTRSIMSSKRMRDMVNGMQAESILVVGEPDICSWEQKKNFTGKIYDVIIIDEYTSCQIKNNDEFLVDMYFKAQSQIICFLLLG